MEKPLWTPGPERVAGAALTGFAAQVRARHGPLEERYAGLHRWSVERPELFWPAVWRHADLVGEPGPTVLEEPGMPGARWFPGARLSFAENLLRRRDDAPAIVHRPEGGPRRELSFAQLAGEVAALAEALRGLGLAPGDRVAGYLPNVPEAVVAMLAASSLGAAWSSCSPDFGPSAALDRLGQVAPRVLVATPGYRYAGREHDARERVEALAAGLPSVEHVLLTSGSGERGAAPAGARPLEAFAAPHRGAAPRFERLPFAHALYVLFSSGTTGAPKCIVHSAGGTLLQHAKEHRLHCDLRPGDRVLYYTTTGWMMWNWLVSALAVGATIVLADGSPAHPGPAALFDLAQEEGVTFFGTSAKYLDAVRKAGVAPRRTHRLDALRTIASTGSPLAPEAFDWVYADVAEDVHLASISGGTDIVSCFVLGDPTGPVWRGEIQVPGLGMAVDVFDDAGRPLRGATGELVCTRPFPSMPVGFWGDDEGRRYRAAYFERFPGVWHHGDLAEVTSHGGYVIHGRSDAVLNPGGVRIGTAEIYRVVEALDAVEEAVAVGQEWRGDVRVVLFVRLRPGRELDEELVRTIRDRLRAQASPRHVPAVVLAVDDVPRTRSGKVSEIAVRETLHGRPLRNREALANPEALAQFANRPELA